METTLNEDLQDKYRLAEENEQLKQQLAEKEKDLIIKCRTIGVLVEKVEKNKQDKISFAVEQLEKMKDCFINGYVVCKDFPALYWNFTQQINDQIDELKGE